jgi:hypothetical protein
VGHGVLGLVAILPVGLGNAQDWPSLALSVAAFLALFLPRADPIRMILAGDAIGLVHS